MVNKTKYILKDAGEDTEYLRKLVDRPLNWEYIEYLKNNWDSRLDKANVLVYNQNGKILIGRHRARAVGDRLPKIIIKTEGLRDDLIVSLRGNYSKFGRVDRADINALARVLEREEGLMAGKYVERIHELTGLHP